MEIRETRSSVLNAAVALGAIASCIGCSSGPAALDLPPYDPSGFADSLLERCDADGNGSLSKAEAASAVGLLTSWSKYDADTDGAITRDEIESHAQHWIDSKDALIPITCIVRLDKRQIGDVTLKFIPDESLQGIVQPAETTSHGQRASFISIPAELKPEAYRKLSGMHYGLYRVEVSHPTMKLTLVSESPGIDISPSDQASPVTMNVKRQ